MNYPATTSIRIPAETLEALRKFAEKEKRSVSQVILMAVEAFLKDARNEG